MRAPLAQAHPVSLRLGRSAAVDLHHCLREVLCDRARVEALMVRAAKESGATVVGSHFHEFSPQGISGVVVITESHFAIHTWPEHGFAAVDVFTCGAAVELGRAIDVLKAGFGAARLSVSHHLERGTLVPPPRIPQPPDAGLPWREVFERQGSGNLLVEVELHGCRGEPSELAQAASGFLGSARELLRLSPAAEPGVVLEGTSAGFSLSGASGGVSGRLSLQTGRAYLSAMSAQFFEPRALAQSALHHLRAEQVALHVRLQP